MSCTFWPLLCPCDNVVSIHRQSLPRSLSLAACMQSAMCCHGTLTDELTEQLLHQDLTSAREGLPALSVQLYILQGWHITLHVLHTFTSNTTMYSVPGAVCAAYALHVTRIILHGMRICTSLARGHSYPFLRAPSESPDAMRLHSPIVNVLSLAAQNSKDALRHAATACPATHTCLQHGS